MTQDISSFREDLTELGKVKLEAPKEIYLDYGPSLPDKYYRDRIVALVRDPKCIFSYWELTGQSTREIVNFLGEYTFQQAQWILRLHNLSQNSQKDLNINPPADLNGIKGAWYFNDIQPDTKYQIEIGMITTAGAFISLAKSNIVITPRLGFAIDQVQPEIYFYLR